MSEGLVLGPYMAARAGFKLTTFQAQGTEPTTEPPHSTVFILFGKSGRRRVKCLIDVLVGELFSVLCRGSLYSTG